VASSEPSEAARNKKPPAFLRKASISFMSVNCSEHRAGASAERPSSAAAANAACEARLSFLDLSSSRTLRSLPLDPAAKNFSRACLRTFSKSCGALSCCFTTGTSEEPSAKAASKLPSMAALCKTARRWAFERSSFTSLTTAERRPSACAAHKALRALRRIASNGALCTTFALPTASALAACCEKAVRMARKLPSPAAAVNIFWQRWRKPSNSS